MADKPEILDLIIIGGGPAGYTAAIYAARAGLRTLLLEKLSPGGQMGTTDIIDNYPGFSQGINGFELAVKMKEGAERFGVKTKLSEVLEVVLTEDIKTVKTSEGELYAKTVIAASGASPRELGLSNERELRGKGVSYCATCDGMFYRNRRVAIVGGGNTAITDALYLAKLCERVYIIHRRDTLRASKVYTDALEAAENIEFVWNSEVSEILSDDNGTSVGVSGGVSGVKVKEKSGGEHEIAVSGVFVAIGSVPNTALFAGKLEMNEQGYILADESTRTSIEGVFAAGDLRQKHLRQIVTAAADGAVAATMAAEWLNM